MSFDAEGMVGRLVLDRYRIVRLLAKGGMGAIFLARSEGAEGFVRPVVIKQILPTHVGDDVAVNSFAREARILSKLRHPGIVGVHDFARQDGTYFMAMEYVHGFNLAQWARFCHHHTRTRQFPVTSAVEIALQVLDALNYVHKATGIGGTPLNVVHRDIKPSNILVSIEGHVKLADFGIARAYQEKTENADKSFIKGTFPYVAPEIFNGADPTPGTDVYACAVVLYQILAGHNPFAGKNPHAIIPKVLTHVPPSLAELRRDVSPELAAVIHHALGKSAAERYPDAASLATALRNSGGFDAATAAEQLGYAAERDFRNPQFAELLNLTDLTFLEAALTSANVEHIDDAAVSARMAAMPAPTAIVDAADLDDFGARNVGRRATSARQRLVSTQSGNTARLDGRSGRMWLGLALVLVVAAAVAVTAVLLLRTGGSGETKVVVVKSEAPSADAGPGDAGAGVDARPRKAQPRVKKKPSSAEELTRAFRKKDAQIQSCFTKHAGDDLDVSQMQVRFRIDARGRVESTEVLPVPISKKPVGKCVEKVARSTKFGYQGKSQTFRIPVSVKRKQ